MGHAQVRGIGVCAVLLATIATLSTNAAWAQTTGSLRGHVSDTDGFPIPRAEVRLRGASLIGGEQLRVTGDGGDYLFTELPPGLYTIQAVTASLGDTTVEGVRVLAGGETVQDVRLAGLTVIVPGERRVLDPTDPGISRSFTRSQLQALPTARSEHALLPMIPTMIGTGNARAAGAAPDESTRMIDGMVVSDPVTNTFGTNFTYDGIDELRVQLGGFMPEHGQSLGAVIEIVTASGGNNLEFDTSVFYTDGALRRRKDARYTADGFQLAPTDFDSTFRTLQIAGRVSGPIVRDKAWLALSYQHSRSLIANTGIPVPRDYDGHHAFAKLTVQPNSAHRFTGSLTLSPAAIDNTLQANPFVKPEAQARQYQSGYVVQGRWQWFPGERVSVDSQVAVQRISLEIGPVPCTHDVALGYHPCKPGEQEGAEDWTTPGRVGQFGAFSAVNFGQFAFDHRMRYTVNSKLSAFQIEDPLGLPHDVKVGVELAHSTWDQLQGRSGNVMYGDVNAIGWDPLSFTNWYRWEITGPIAFQTSGTQWSAFAQDSWRLRKNLVIKGGLRHDAAVLRNDLGHAVVSQRAWGPRIYGAWDPTGDNKTKIVGGYGRFYDTGRLAVASFTSASAIGAKLWIGELGGGDLASSQGTMYSLAPRENPSIAHDRLRAPRSDELTLQVGRQVLSDVGVGLQSQYKRTSHLFEHDERNLVYDEDGSSVIGSRFGDDQIPQYRMRTPAIARRDFAMVNAQLTKVEARRWFGEANYTWSMSWGTSPRSLSGAFANAPQTRFAYGPMLETDVRHAVRAYVGWQLPLDPNPLSLAATFIGSSGFPVERLYPTEEPPPGGSWGTRIRPRGSYTRTPPQWSLGLKATQSIALKSGALQLDIQLLNALGARAPIAFLPTLHSENRLFVAARQEPMRVQVGARYVY